MALLFYLFLGILIIMKNKKIKQKTPPKKVEQMVRAMGGKQDPEGAYTGKPVKKGEAPVQDADDL